MWYTTFEYYSRDMKILLVLAIVFISLGLNVALVYRLVHIPKYSSMSSHVQQAKVAYPNLSYRILLENERDLLMNFVPLRSQLRSYVEKQTEKVGVYFEYLPTGTSIGVNEKEAFIPASLLKLPLAMTIYQKASTGELSLDEKIILEEQDLDPMFGQLYQKGAGYSLSIKQAVKILLYDSDNTAQHALFRKLDQNDVAQVFQSLDIPVERDAKKQITVTPKNYSSILRCLFLACYLSKQDSNSLLELLANTPFDNWVAAGVPKDVKIAHKIGVGVNQLNSQKVYTDCGIVYLTKRPYMLCVMIEGPPDRAQSIFKDISSMVYQFVTSQ